MYVPFLSLRFIQRHWLMTLIGSFFVGASLVVLIVVMAVMDGFQFKLKETYAGSSADMIVTPRFKADLSKLDVALRERLGERLVATAPHYQTITMVRREGLVDPALMEEFQVAQVFGVDGAAEQRVNRFREYLHRAPDRIDPMVEDLDEPFKVHDPELAAFGFEGVILGADLQRELHVVRGQRIKLFALVPRSRKDEKGTNVQLQDFELRQRLFLVLGTYKSGNSEIDSRSVFMSDKTFTTFFDAGTSRRSIRAKLADPDDGFQECHDLLEDDWFSLVEKSLPAGQPLPPWLVDERPDAELIRAFHVHPWWEQYLNLVRAIESEKAMILVIAFLIVIAGTSSIFAAQWLLVSDKVREIGILRALGAHVGGVASIFVMNGFLMGLVGSAAGTGLGLVAVRYIDTIHDAIRWVTGRDPFNPEIYLFTKIPTRVDMTQIGQFAVAALICTLIAAAIPAIRAGFMDPAKALHHE